jgi:peptidoglycan/xylan/chitin deacetylase (PgdA/CDA1 family)
MDFTLSVYRRLLDALLEAYEGGEYLVRKAIVCDDARCVLRHDVDRWPENARRMAVIEKEHGVRSSYYFRSREVRRCGSLIQEVARLGHEVGYHHEAMSRAHGDPERAKGLFAEDLTALRALVPRVSTVAAHGAPLSGVDNREFWRFHVLADFALEAEAFHLVDKPHWTYLTDTGRSWSPGSANLRDHAPYAATLGHVSHTEQLVAALPTLKGDVCLVVHPERWNPPGLLSAISWGRDAIANRVKRTLSVQRPRRAKR